MILLPAVDIMDGRAVRLERGEFDRRTVYSDEPVAAARAWVEQGAHRLHVVDLDGARHGAPESIGHLERIASELGVEVQYGGGLRSVDAVERAVAAGAAGVVVGTAAYEDPAFLAELLERWPERVTVAVDVRGGRLSTSGWTEEAPVSAEEAIGSMLGRGVSRFMYTDVDHDGMLDGPDREEVRRVAEAVGPDATFLYSGGVASVDDLVALRDLELTGLIGVVSGKALYEGRFTFAEGRAALGG